MKKPLVFLFFIIGGIVNLSALSKVDIEKAVLRIDGIDLPMVGFGTYLSNDRCCTQSVSQAIEIGYRIIDTATLYRNFDAIAKALNGRDRRQFYLISKVWHDKQGPSDLRIDLELTLKQLKTDYLDAYLLHWPNSKISIEETLSTMNELVKERKVRHIGLSNVSTNHLKRAMEVGVPITWVQIEMHPHFYDAELLEFCKEHAILVQAWAPLGRGRICHDPILAKIGRKYRKTASQVAIRWIVQHGCVPLPGSANSEHILEDWKIDDFMLSSEEMRAIDQRAKVGVRERISFFDEFDYSYEQCWPK